ncbi:MMPL family transporter [Nocardioides sp. zg-536]|uniref:MMPL family transporter n=1 Tax=Nocardioides faecalis TaxID=2803858 RepID=A0A938Y8D8_9ACTN|nr:MMPL family transporter [Nocardioides faecalis]MBM9459735.1 MMPL family transporter [Nocardioides faecalis]MBS4753488.1 MMPL family transporter [Nocardioides faecalis]QVI60701.1 MMPL family transporter [Nocardioides faecalis]
MFAALGRFVTRFRWFVIAAWLLLAVVVSASAPALESTQDNSEFLPEHYESVQALALQEEKFSDAFSPGAILVVEREDGGELTAADQAAVGTLATQLAPELGTKTFQPLVIAQDEQGKPNLSPDAKVMFAVIPLAEDASGYDAQAFEDGQALRDAIDELTEDTGLEVRATGTVPQGLDSQESGERALLVVGIATIVLIVGLLALIFRSVLICLLPLVTVGIVSVIATGVIGWANAAFDLKADSSVEQILVVVLYGVGTDYILFFLFRHRERLRQGASVQSSVVHSLDRAGEAIASAGGAVIVAFMALVLSSLSIFRAIGPALAIAVFVTLLAALTLVPALVSLLGKALFWPSKAWQKEPKHGAFIRIGRTVGRRPGRTALVSGGVMAVLAIFALGFNPSFDFNSSLPEGVESTEALETFQENFSAGAAEPVPVLLDTDGTEVGGDELAAFGAALGEAQGVDAVSEPVPAKDGTAFQYYLTLADDPTSDAAQDNVGGPIRDVAHDAAPEGTEAFVGGTPGIFADMSSAMARDYRVVFPVAAGVILLILALLLRSLVAPWFLMAAVGLGFAATLGLTVIAFQLIGDETGLIFILPIYIYLFVTALGTDYNILMIARLREEGREGHDPHAAAAQAVTHAGPTIGAAGLILAGTFASLMLAGNTLLVSMGFALAVGILIVAFVMSMFFTPALTSLLGHAAWWPGHGDRARPDGRDGRDGRDGHDGHGPDDGPAPEAVTAGSSR